MVESIMRRNGIISAEQTINAIKREVPYYNNEGDMYSALIRLAKYHNGRRATELTENEMVLYDFLLKINIHPDTAYYYLRLYMVSDDLKARYAKGKISRQQIAKFGSNEVKRLRIRKFLSIITDGRKLFEELDWR